MIFILSFISSANGCNVQYCTCSNGSWVTFGQYCPVSVYTPQTQGEVKQNFTKKALAFDKVTGAYGIGNNKSGGKAKKEALSNCGTANCKIVFYDKSGTVVASSNGIVVSGYYNDSGKTMEECQKQGGINCTVIYRPSPYDY